MKPTGDRPKRACRGMLKWLMLTCLMAASVSAQTTNKYTFSGLNLPVPDGSGSGVSFSTNLVSSVANISNVQVRLTLAGQFNGDLYAYLRHITPTATNLCVLVNRPGRTIVKDPGYDDAGMDVVLSATAANDFHMYGEFTNVPPGAPVTGTWQPDGRKINPRAVRDSTPRTALLDVFNGMDGTGEWTLFVSDIESGGTNMLVGWELVVVSPPNLPPTLAAISNLTTNEDSGTVTIPLTGISAGLGETQALAITATSSNPTLIPNPSVTYTSPAATGSLAFTPAANTSGTATITVVISDDGGTANGGVDKTTNTFTVAVNAVNDAPSFVKGADQTVNEDASARTVAGWATAISPGPANESGQTVSFIVANDNNGLFSAQPAISASTGTLTYTPAANAFGAATVTAVLQDNGGTANGGVDKATNTFIITVNPVNDAPSFVKGSDQTVNEDAGAQTVPNWATAISPGPANESGQTLSFTAGNNNASLFSVQPAISSSGTLTYTPAANANGSATVTVQLRDNGGVLNGGLDASPSQELIITVSAVNDTPTLAAISNLTTNEDASLITVNLAGIGAGGGESQTLTVTAKSSNTGLIPDPTVSYVSASSSGTLTFTPVPNANGTATISVVVADNGGTLNGGVDKVTNTFTVTVNAVNDAPTLAAISNLTTNEDPGLITVNLAGISAGGGESQTLTVASTSSNPGLIPNPSVTYASPAATGTLAFTPAANASGTATITVVVSDDGGTLNGGVDKVTNTFTVTVNTVNDAPTLAAISNLTTNEDASLITVNLAGISAGGGESQTLTVTATSSNPGLIPNPSVTYASPAATGTLAFTPVTNAYGSAIITVVVADNGGTLNGGVDKVTNTFTVTVNEVNDAPVAGGDSLVRSLTSGTKVLISNLLTNDTDLENDAISFVSVASTSANGGTVVSNGNWVFYTPPAGNNNVDTFTYTIRDARGAIGIGTVTVTPTNGNDPANNLQITDLGNGTFRLRFDGIPESFYDLETTPTLSPANWSFWISTNTDANGILSVIDTAANATNKFYRTVLK